MPNWPWERSDAKPVDPERPHAFRQTDDFGLAAVAASGPGGVEGSGSQAVAAAVTDSYRRTSRCGVPGCSRERGDPIHQTEAG